MQNQVCPWASTRLLSRLAWLALAASTTANITANAAVLTHRYSFATDASDLVANANGVLQGNAIIANGALLLDGTNSSVGLPNDLFTHYDSISFEVWYAEGPVSTPSGQLYNFSGAQGGMNYYLVGEGLFYTGGSSESLFLPVPAVGGTNHLIWTQDQASQTACLYVNGRLAVRSATFTNTPAMVGSTATNLIGAGATNVAASHFKGQILEFRTWQGALAPLDAAVLDAFGPETPQSDPGTLQAVRLIIPSPTGPGALFRAGVFADFSGITNVDLSTQPDLVLTSDNTNVISLAPDQRLRTVALGTADITANWRGFSNTVTVTVAVPQDIALVHRYGFNEPTNEWVLHDSAGVAHGKVVNSSANPATPEAAFTGQGELRLQGANSPYAPNGYAVLPPGILSSLSEVTVETWVTWTLRTAWPWQRIFDFGSASASPGAGSGLTYFFLTTEANTFATSRTDLARFTVSTNQINGESPRLNWTNIFPTNVTTHVAVAYSPARGIAKMYLNGTLISSGKAVIPLSAIVDTNNWLGRSQYTGDSFFGGRYQEFRIYRGLLTDADVAADYAAGPDTVGVDYELHSYAASNGVTITWGPSATNLVLQSSPTLGSGALWNPVPVSPVPQNGRVGVTLPVTGNAAYFRLSPP